MFTFGSVCTGIGGIDLGLERADMYCEWQVENDAFCQKVLEKHWPHVARYGDIRELDTSTLAGVDLLAGGIPCQPHSLAGERKGSADERNLWPEFYRIVCELKPRWVLVENVLGLLSSENGSFFGQILSDLAKAGYDAEWFVFRASDVGAPHQRERVFIVAYSSSCRLEKQQDTVWSCNQFDSSSFMAHSDGIGECRKESGITSGQCCQIEPASVCEWEDRTSGVGLADPHCKRLEVRDGSSEEGRACTAIDRCCTGQSQSRLGGMSHGISRGMDGYRWPAGPGENQYDWEPLRVSQEKKAHRGKRLKALGNAVVPQVAEYIGHVIMQAEKERV